MKIAVIGFSGNLGKTTIARHLLAARMKDARVIAVESINSDDSDDQEILGKQYGELLENLVFLDNVVVDVGASNVEVFLRLMKQYRGSHEDFDFYVVPSVSRTKQLRDTIATIDSLSEIGIPAKKIRLVFNMVELDEDPERSFAPLFDYHASEKKFTLRTDAVVHVNEIYDKLKGTSHGIAEILNDPADLKEQLKGASNSDEKLEISRRIGIKRLAAGVTEELDSVFKTLLK